METYLNKICLLAKESSISLCSTICVIFDSICFEINLSVHGFVGTVVYVICGLTQILISTKLMHVQSIADN